MRRCDRRVQVSPWAVPILAALMVLSGTLAFLLWPTPVRPARSSGRSLLIVGDSLTTQAVGALREWHVSGVDVRAYGGSGSAPCDWVAGYRDPISGRFFDFTQVFDAVRPATVSFAFTGNPGLSGPAGGCVDAGRPYPLADLLAEYRADLTAMATYASTRGAGVFFDASPPRNPATPPGHYLGDGGLPQYGFNGVAELNQLYRSLASSVRGRARGWRYDPGAAAAVSGRGLSWRAWLPCRASDHGCVDGRVRVRAGGLDAIHLDEEGAGGARYAAGLVHMPLMAMGRADAPLPAEAVPATRR